MKRLALVSLAATVFVGCQDVTQPDEVSQPLFSNGPPADPGPPPAADHGLAIADERNGDTGRGNPRVFPSPGVPFPEGHVGYDVAISVDGVLQFFSPSQLQSTTSASSTQDEQGVVRLSTPLCTDFSCFEFAAVRALLERSFPAGTTVNFELLTIEGLPNADASAHCRLDRLPNFATIPGTFFQIPASSTLGDNIVTLDADEDDGIVLHCEVGSDGFF
jgi:hypothetical protein